MRGVDLNTYTFDYDLTFAVLLMNADGTIYHRYGSRDGLSAMSRMSMSSLVKVIRDTLADHAAYQKNPSPPRVKPRRAIEQMPTMAAKLRKKPDLCFHCHMVYDGQRDIDLKNKQWDKSEVYKWPLPEQIGLVLDREDQSLVTSVKSATPADAAGIKPGDRLTKFENQLIRTQTDVQWVLENAPSGKHQFKAEVQRNDQIKPASIAVKENWKVTDPITISWRPTMWGIGPKPGFGGDQLKPDDLKNLGLKEDAFAFRVRYIVTWGSASYTGRNAIKAGIRKGDVVYAVDGKNDFESVRHYHAWFRMTRKLGSSAEYSIIRNGKRLTVSLPVKM